MTVVVEILVKWVSCLSENHMFFFWGADPTTLWKTIALLHIRHRDASMACVMVALALEYEVAHRRGDIIAIQMKAYSGEKQRKRRQEKCVASQIKPRTSGVNV